MPHDAHLHGLTKGTRTLNVLAVAWCGGSLALIGPFLMLITWAGVLETTRSALRGDPGDTIGSGLLTLTFWLLTSLLGLAFGRFLVRAMPPRLSGHAVRVHALSAAFAIAVVATLQFVSLIVLSRGDSTTSLLSAPRAARLAVVIPSVGWLIGACGPVWLRYRRADTFLYQPFVLFLRRFSTFSDRAVSMLVLRETPARMPVVFLTAVHSHARDWNPFVVGLAGLKLRHPFRSAPVVLRASDEHWQPVAAQLIDAAAMIVIDLSDQSDAMRNEIAMIEAGARWSSSICLRLSRSEGAPAWMASLQQPVITYTKSWRQAMPRLALGALLSLCSGVALYVSTYVSLGLLFDFVFDLSERALEVTIGFGIVLATIVTVTTFAAVFAVPAVDPASRRAIRAALRQHGMSAGVDHSMELGKANAG
jgi:hypothetical protein